MGFGLIIVGTKYRTKKISPPSGYTDLPAQYCPFCRSYQAPAFLRTDKYFTFFFIPIIRLKKDHQIQVTCSNCKHSMVLPPKGALSTYQRSDQQHPEASHNIGIDGRTAPASATSMCPACGQLWNPENKYCPKDGTPRPPHVSA
jgi:zinc-ribbon family